MNDSEISNQFIKLCRKGDVDDKVLAQFFASASTGSAKEKRNQAQLLIELAAEATLFYTPDSEAYAVVPVNGHQENWPLRTKDFKSWLVRRFYEALHKGPNSQALEDALKFLESEAQFGSPKNAVFIRLAEAGNIIYLDLSNETWEAVEITPDGWRIVRNPPVRFRRARGMAPLPIPTNVGNIDELRQFVNVESDDDWYLLLAWLISALRPTGPYPILVLQGEQGSAKSTTSRVLRALLDPSTAPLRSIPQKERDLMIAAKNSWILSFDNLSGVPTWLSDAICRLSTGGGFATRELYTNTEEVIFVAQRPVVINGIDDLIEREDLRDRAIILSLPTIQDRVRRDEKDFWSEFEVVRPRILGALLNAVSVGLKNLPETHLERLPRMADFAKWVTAAEPALGWPTGSFLEVYSTNRLTVAEIGVETDPLAEAVRKIAQDGTWTGTATNLLHELSGIVDDLTRKTCSWPRTHRALANRLRRVAPTLRVVGVEVEFRRESQHRLIYIRSHRQ